MSTTLIKTLGFFLIILFGYFGRQKGFFSEDDQKFLSKIVVNFTLPAALFCSFREFILDFSLFWLAAIGLILNIIMIGFGLFIARKKDKPAKALYMLNCSSYNIGSFTLPFINSFFGPPGVIIISMFDLGNALMCAGTTYAFASILTGTSSGNKFVGSLKAIFSSVPLDTYLFMFTLALLGIQLPEGIFSVVEIFSQANPFLSMLMIGMMINLRINKEEKSTIATIVISRCIFAIIVAFLMYNYLPFPLIVRQVLVVASFAPIVLVAPVYTEKCGANGSLASVMNSITILVSLACFMFLTVLWG